MTAFRLFVRTALVACLLLVLLRMIGGNVQAANSSDKNSIIQNLEESQPTDQIIIKYKQSEAAFSNPEHLAQVERLSEAAGAPLQYFREMSGDAHVLQLQERLPLEQVRLLAQRLLNLPEVEYAEADQIMTHTLVPNDPQYTNQWHYFGSWGINLPAAWDITTGSSSIVAAVIDTGITNHADLSGRTVPGYDFISNIAVANDGNGRDINPSDPGDWVTANECFSGSSAQNSSWHGTHVAGTIGAASNNGLGVAGVNWNSKILPVRVLGKCGGSISDIADAMRWSAGLAIAGVPANSNPAKVLNLSLGGSGTCSATYQNAINDATAAGAVVVISAGNSNANASGFQPANCSGVITVAATNHNGSKANYSNFGSTVEISAPGGQMNNSASNGVLSTLNTGTTVPAADSYAYYQGTSMAAPHVSGVVSLVLSRNPSLTPSQILSILQSTAKAFPGSSTCNTSICGSGIVDAGAAVNAAGPSGNDDFGNAIPITAVPYSNTQSVGSATTATDDPTFTCISGQRNNTVWYRYTPTANGTLTVNTFSSDYDTILAVWTGTRGNLTSQGCNDDFGGGIQSQVQLMVNAGTAYHIEIAAFSPITTGSLSISVTTTTSGSFPLTVSRSGTGTGTVTSSPAGINCGSDCSENYNSGTVVTLSASAAPDSTFTGWSGGGCSGAGNCIVTMNAATSVTANFDLAPTGTIFNNSFEEDDCFLSPWSSCNNDNGDLTYNPPPLVAVGNQSMNILIDDNNAVYVTSDHPNAEPRYLANFYFDPNSIAMVNGDTHTIFGGYAGTSTLVLRLQFRRSSGLYQVQAAILNDGSTFTPSSWFTISDAPHQIKLDWRASTAAGANNGGLTLSIDGVQKADLIGVDNDTRRIDRARLGAVAAVDTGTRGTYYFDEFESSRAGAQSTATLTVTKTGSGSGMVTSNPAGINCGSDCSETYNTGTMVTLTATADSGSIFNGWSGGGCSGTSLTCMVNLTGNVSVNADFTMASSQPDLIIESIASTPANPQTNQAITFSVVIKNQGQADASGFWVDLFIDTSPPPDCSGVGQVYQQVGSLAAGASQTLIMDYAGFSIDGVHTVNGTVDTNCDVNESNEGNNTRSINLTVGSDLIFANSFEDDDCFTTQWSACVDDAGDLHFDGPSLVGDFGISMYNIIDDNNMLYVTSDHPNAEPRYRARFYFDPNSITMVNGDLHRIFYGYSGATKVVLRVEFRRSSGLYQLRAGLLTDGSAWRNSSWFTITDAPHPVELDWRAATTAGANNGGLTLWIDGAQKANLTAVDNDTWRIDRVRLGAVNGIDTGTRGTYYFDAFEARRQNYIGP